MTGTESRNQTKRQAEPVYLDCIALVDRITCLTRNHLEVLGQRLHGCELQSQAKRDEGRPHLIHAMRAVVENYLDFCNWEVLDARGDAPLPETAVSAPPTRRVRWPAEGEED